MTQRRCSKPLKIPGVAFPVLCGLLRKKFELIGSYPDLVAQAQMWDGKSDVDPVGYYLENARKERIEAQLEGEMTAEEYLAEQARKAAAESVPSLFTMEMYKADMTPEMEEIKAAAVADGTFMKAPNGKDSNLNERQWLQVRTKAFADWFGDWNRAAELTFVPVAAGWKETKNALKSLKGVPLRNLEKGIIGYVNRDQRNELANPNKARISADNGFSTTEHYVAAQHIQELFKHATLCGVYEDDAGHSDLEMLRFVCPFRYDGVLCYAFITAKRSLGGQDTNDTKVYNLELMDTIRLDSKIRDKAQYAKEPNLSSKEILARVKELSKTYFDNVSKVVDENGEPLVVTHATNSEPFTVFKRGERAGLSGKGIYFSPDGVGIWGKNVIRCFLNVRNPLTKENAPREVNNGGMSAVIPDVFEQFPQFDGVMLRRDEITVRDPEQIKSATDNRGTFDGRNPDITFNMERNLAAVHSLSAEKFLGALELGGMPLPSVAVTRLDKPYSWGSEKHIYLVGRPELVDPRKGTEVYSRDAWTGNIPHLLHKPVGKDDRSKACLDLQEISDKYRLRSDYNDYFRLEGHISLRGSHENVDKSDMEYHLRRPAGQALFAWQSGYRPRPKMKDAVRVHDWLTKEFAEKLREYTKLTPDEYHEKEREVMELARKEAEAFYGERAVIKNAPNAEAAQKRLGAWVNTAMRVFDVYSPSALARELDEVKLIGKRVLDTEGNLKMLAAYADKHKRAYEAWVQAKLDAWFSKERYIKGTNTLATLEALTRHMLGDKARGKEKGLAFGAGLVRAHHAERMETLADIQRRRELLTDSEASNELKSETNELMEYWREGAAAILSRGMNGFGFEVRDDLMETLAKVKGEPTAEKLSAAVRKMFRGATNLQELLNNAEVIGYGVDALKSLHAELEDYMEAVPQRAVKMDEWEYAVMPERLKKNKAVMAGLRENGIRPRFHDGTEEGRKAALAGLVNDSRVSFSVIGPKAETWEWYQDVAFKGRDDGMLRAEIDASGARLKTLTGAAAYDYRREVENVQDFWRKRYARWMELDALFDTVYYSDEEPTEEQRAEAAAAAEEYYMLTEEVKDMMEALIERGGAWPSYTQLEAADKQALRMGMVRSLAAGKVDEAVYEKLGALSAGEKIYSLEDVLDFPELYEAYPKLKLVPVQFELLGRYNGLVTNYAYGAEYSVIKLNKPLLENADAFRSTLLHEVQHVIQRIEGYAKGGNVEGVYKHMKDELEYNDAEMKRLAKELRWFSALDYAKDYLKSARRLLRFPNAWKYNGLRYRHWKAALGNEDMTRLLVDDIAEQYEELRKADEFETKRRGNWIKPVEYALPMVDFSDLAGVERGLAALEGLKPRRSAFRGAAPKKDKEYIKLMKYTNAAKRMLDKYAMEPYELYRRLAGEIEARNVQTRRDWTMDERLARPFNETLEYPGEALVTFSMESVSAEWQNTLERFVQMPPVAGTPAYERDINVCPTPAVMQMVGARGLEVVMAPHVLVKCLDEDIVLGNGKTIKEMYADEDEDQGKHKILLRDMQKLTYALADPICIAESNSPGSIEVITELKEGDKNVLVAVRLNTVRTGVRQQRVNRITSLYGKNKIEKLLTHKMLYWNNEKARRWTGDRGLQLPTVPYPERAYEDNVYTPADLVKYKMQTGLSFSMERASLQALEVLRTRADEREGERLMNDWQKACEGWAQLHVGGDDSRLGNGAKMLGEIYALIGATKGVLPEKYTRMGHLNGLLRWAAVYANMQQTGDVPAAGVIAGPIYEKFVERMRYIDKKNEAYGLNEAEVKEAMALLAGERLDVAMLKVARECKQRLELFLKDRERERIDWVVERAYPKREKGKRSPRGKMDAETYRRMERAYRLMAMEANEVAGLMNLIKSALDKTNDEPAEAVTVLRAVRGGDVPGVDEVEALEAELEDELFLAQTFGCWENMAFEQARRASGAMAELVLLGRSAWQSKLRAERRRAAFDRDEVSSHFGTKLEDVQAVRGDKTAKEKGRKRTSAKNLVMGSMSYSQLLVALEEKLGKRFTGRHMRMIAEAHERIMMENQRRHRWMYNTLRDITGLETEGEIEEWMQKNNEIIDTGIDLDMPMKTTCRLTPEEARMWLSLTAEERQKKRDEMGVEAAKKREKPDNVPGEDVMAELEERLMEAEQADAMPKEFVFTTEWSYKSRLKCTREALLYAILTFEQEDYEHLLEANGLTQAKLQQMRKLVGKELLRWGYEMRKELSEHGKMVAELYEAYTGVPFGQRQNYFRGVFDVARAKDAGEAVDQVSGVTGGKYGILIARQYHNQQLNWSTSASLVFVATMKEQQNYIATAHITREWRTLLSDRLFERRVRAEIGDAALDMLTGWMKMIDGAVLADAKVNTIMNNMVGKLAKAYAVSRLAGNAYTIMKQASALLNGFVGGYVPERVLAGNELVQELTYRHVGFGEYMAALGKAMAGKTEITMKELESAGFIEGRKNVQGSHIEEAALLSPWQTVPGKVGRKGRALYEANMEAIGFVDRKANAKAALAIAEVVYQQAKKENADGLVPDAELRRVALETARMMVDRAAQPQLRTQKGYLAAGGGAFGAMGNFFYMFKSETLNKLGLYVAQMMAGQHRAWLVGALSFGVMNSVVLALIDWICGRWYDDDDEKWEKRAKSFAGNVFFNDIATVPFAGDIVDWVRGQWLGERYWASNSLVSWGTDTWKYGARVWENIDEGASWDKHVTALCSLARSVGALGGVGLNGHSAAVGSCCELTLAAASLSNTVRFFKDVVKKVVGE